MAKYGPLDAEYWLLEKITHKWRDCRNWRRSALRTHRRQAFYIKRDWQAAHRAFLEYCMARAAYEAMTGKPFDAKQAEDRYEELEGPPGLA